MAQNDLNAATAEEIRTAIDAEDEARAGVYVLLGTLLRAAPSAEILDRVRGLDQADGRDGFALAWEGLRLAAASVSAPDLEDEYQVLFVGLGRGELVPYGSWYLTGFLMEKPLGDLRRELALLGFEREPGVCEPEDHIAALCDVMAQMATDPQVSVDRQRAFYETHIGSWVDRFCADLESAESAVFYRAVARLGSAFFELERRFLEMES
jgi:TorA maturation chaperone TorD